MSAGNSAVSTRRKRAVESYRTAAEAIGAIEPGLSLFAVTRGQWSMIDAVLACLDQVGPARLSLWTWTIAEYEVEVLERLWRDERVIGGTMVIDYGARNKNLALIRRWRTLYGPDSVRYVVNRAKIATVETDRFKLLLRGSMNLNFNPRFEQFDITEGGEDFDLVRRIEEELPVLADDASGSEAYKASRVAAAFEPQQLALFKDIKVWAK